MSDTENIDLETAEGDSTPTLYPETEEIGVDDTADQVPS